MRFFVKEANKRKSVYDILNIFYDRDDIIFDENSNLVVLEDYLIFNAKKYHYEDINQLKLVLFDILVKEEGYRPAWGILTGSKPSKLFKKTSYENLKEKYRVSENKLNLLERVIEEEKKLDFAKDAFSLYINIPFCPSRCNYCSYPTLVGNMHDKKTYIDFILKELDLLDIPKNLDSIYIGGGTPSYLKEDDLDRLLSRIRREFTYKEFTFEAGREDTLTEEKLDILKKNKVGRISLNPQTFNDDIIKKANRAYDIEHFLKIYKHAKDLGLIVNMDFIIGLMGEDSKKFRKNFDILKELLPDNITFHGLAMKVGSNYFEKNKKINQKESIAIASDIRDFVREYSYKPYYLYRQKNMLSELENIGYHRNETSQRYNIIINEELSNIIGVGMNANSKLTNGKKFRASRNLRDYYENIDREIASKNKLIDEYNNKKRSEYGN